MANDTRTDSEPRLAAIVNGILNDVQELIKQQFAFFRAEVKEDLRKTKEAALSLVCGGGLALLGGLLLAHALVYLLAWAAPTLPLWSCYAIVAGVLLLGGGVLLYVGKNRLEAFNPLPDETVAAAKENVQWLMKSKTPN